MTRTYSDGEHRRIAEFAGWKPDQKCSEGWTVLNSALSSLPSGHVVPVVAIPAILGQPSGVGPKIQFSRCIHGMIAEHVISPPPLDDALAMACLRKLGELNVSPWLDHWNTRPIKWRMHSTHDENPIYADDPCDAIFALVLALRRVGKLGDRAAAYLPKIAIWLILALGVLTR